MITIIGLLSSIVVLDFRGARQRQQLALLSDQSLALLQQSQAEVRSGKVEDDVFVCKGSYLQVGQVPLLAQAPFVEGDCDFSVMQLEAYGFSNENAVVAELSVGAVELEELYVLFTPPEGQVRFYDAQQQAYVGSAVLGFEHTANEDLHTDLNVSYLSGQVYFDHEH